MRFLSPSLNVRYRYAWHALVLCWYRLSGSGQSVTLRFSCQRKCSLLLLLVIYAHPCVAASIIDDWTVIADSLYPDRPVQIANAEVLISAPAQAEDSAQVPIRIQFADGHGSAKWTLFVDANPIMLNLTTQLPDTSRAFAMSTRICQDANSKVRVISVKTDGRLFMATVDIKTPRGGCSGRAASQDEAALHATAGNIKLRQLDEGMATILQIQHPMRTGFERAKYGYTAKAWYLDKVEWLQSANQVMSMQLGPGISANPYFRVDHPFILDNLMIKIFDNEHQQFSFPKTTQSKLQ